MTALDWPDCRNVRDVGGLPTPSAPIRRKVLVRADRLGGLSADGIAAVRAYGVSRVLDLRRAEECDEDPNPFAGDDVYLHHPVQDPEDQYDLTLDRVGTYLCMLDQRPKLFASALAAIADAPAGAVVVHCHAGKDRTGLVVAMALSLAGVPAEAIAEDYGLSEVGLRALNEATLAEITDPVERERVREVWSCRPDTITTVLGELDARYGGVAAYLASGGLTRTQVNAVRRRLVG